jgi:hypothetical protein
MKSISARAIRKQLWEDLVGKDAYRGVSLTYAWLANQFGHFSLGFIPTILIYICIIKSGHTTKNINWPYITIALIWLVIELCIFTFSIFKKGKIIWFKIYMPRFPFKPVWCNLIFDLITDIGFFWSGTLGAALVFVFNLFTAGFFTLLIILLFLSFRYWYPAKMYLQEARYPFHFRLSQWDLHISNKNKDTVETFLKSTETGKQILIFGKDIAEKTSLCVGIATELSFKRKTCTYLTAIKLFSMFFEQDTDDFNIASKSLWAWRDSSLLIIDDINLSHTTEELISVNEFYDFLNNDDFSKENREVILNRKIIWVLGKDTPENTKEFAWKNLLKKIGVEEGNISIVDLS